MKRILAALTAAVSLLLCSCSDKGLKCYYYGCDLGSVEETDGNEEAKNKLRAEIERECTAYDADVNAEKAIKDSFLKICRAYDRGVLSGTAMLLRSDELDDFGDLVEPETVADYSFVTANEP